MARKSKKKEVIEEPALEETPIEEPVATEVVDMDKKLEEIPTVSGEGIQAYMREVIKNATKRK